jgi:hypothetical protein
MLMHASATFQIRTWDEMPYDPIEGGTKLTRAKVTRSIKGDLEGEGAVEYLMFIALTVRRTSSGLNESPGNSVVVREVSCFSTPAPIRAVFQRSR